MTFDSRFKFILGTMVFALAADLVAWKLRAGWPAAALITAVINLVLLFYVIRQKDTLLAKLLFFGVLVGFGELPTDHLAVAIQKTLVYPSDEPFIWSSPAYMPFSWTIVMTQFGYLAWWMTQRWGLAVATVLTGILGAVNLPAYEFLAKGAGFWYYRNATMVFFDSTPVYVIVGEFLLTLSIPYIVRQVERSRVIAIVAWSGVQSLLIYLSTVVAYHFFA
ncbi:DUF6989 domain-containing protein [Methylomarinum vadi]|uniref:DUF6989 domain-containing protein n=1 Tax=Methylomarinum vadi TaxID=438855 RepID=UPI0004DF0557|nr:hypothetical protein [Methylomarinum vadi]